MDFPPGYLIALTSTRIERHFPNLNKNNFYFKSLKTDDYNCVAWSIERDDDWIEFPFNSAGNYDDGVGKYIDYFKSLGFEIIENSAIESGVKKIAIYVDKENNFKHVARLLSNGKWASVKSS